jgi:mono/diheme cytochrome c family protein
MDFRTTGKFARLIIRNKAAMHTFLFLNQRRRVRLVWPCVLAVLGCMVFASASAQNTPSPTRQSGTSGQKPPLPEATNQSPTYLRDIQPIFMGNCSRCHNQQSRFVYDWLDYKTAYADRWEIRRRIWDSWKGSYYKEPMPVANSPESLALTDEERQTICEMGGRWRPRGVPPPPGAAKIESRADRAGPAAVHLHLRCLPSAHGPGTPQYVSTLAGSDFLNADKNRAIKIVLFGRQGEVVVNGMKFNNNMPSFPLTDQDVANVLTFVYNSFGNSGLEVTPEEVKLRAQPPPPPRPSRPPCSASGNDGVPYAKTPALGESKFRTPMNLSLTPSDFYRTRRTKVCDRQREYSFAL